MSAERSRTVPRTDVRIALARRYRLALADALTALRAFGYEADAKEIEDRYSLVYVNPGPDIRLSTDVSPAERQFEGYL